jgi:hypothetical protein
MDIIKPRGVLGTGHFDRKLIERMVELSEADNYEEASKEWIATGNVYWGTMELPEWWEDRAGECLCGHKIVYHFEVQNSENDTMILVGSEHINTYQILRQISLSTGLAAEMITDEMIDEWLTVRVASMMTTAWWSTYGELFTEMFDAVKEYDVRVNVNVKKWQYDSSYGKSLPVTTIRKGSKGSQIDSDYRMASVVWRWNHPDNPKAQIETRGYPTDKLWTDLIIFHARITEHIETCKKEDDDLVMAKSRNEKRIALLESQRMMLYEDAQNKKQALFEEYCEYYGIPIFKVGSDGVETPDKYFSLNNWERRFLIDITSRLEKGFHLSERQLDSIRKIFIDNPATQKQLDLLCKLGWIENIDLNKKEASALITKKIEQQKGEQNE